MTDPGLKINSYAHGFTEKVKHNLGNNFNDAWLPLFWKF